MFLRIDRGSSTPISRQIYEQIAALCASGSLRPGERIASVRQLARELTVNQNTVLRVYEKLVADGLLEMRHGEGTFVSNGSRRRSLGQHRRQCRDELSLIAQRGMLLGISSEELRQLFDEVIAEVAHKAKSQANQAGEE